MGGNIIIRLQLFIPMKRAQKGWVSDVLTII